MHIVSENVAIPKAGFGKNEYFASSTKEKLIRADLKSSALRLLNQTDVVILDAGNYIKGYRYELYCASKAVRTTQCTLFCAIQTERALAFNANRTMADVVDTVSPSEDGSDEQRCNNGDVPYSGEIFAALCQRYEEPHGNARWDAPLFTRFPDDDLDADAIHAALYDSKPPPPNKSTQSVSGLFQLYIVYLVLFELYRYACRYNSKPDNVMSAFGPNV